MLNYPTVATIPCHFLVQCVCDLGSRNFNLSDWHSLCIKAKALHERVLLFIQKTEKFLPDADYFSCYAVRQNTQLSCVRFFFYIIVITTINRYHVHSPLLKALQQQNVYRIYRVVTCPTSFQWPQIGHFTNSWSQNFDFFFLICWRR